MVQGPSFLYFLHFDGNFYCRDEWGNVLTTATPTPLTFTPDGWQEVSILTELNKEYFGFERSFTIPLKFVEDGAAILKKIYYSQGIEGKLMLSIAEQKLYTEIDALTNQGDYYFYYDRFYTGEVDFSTFDHDGPLVTANIIQGGLAKLIKANENTTYEIDIPDTWEILMDGIDLRQKGNFSFLSGLDVQRRNVVGTSIVNLNNVFLPLAYINSEGQSTGVVFSTSQYQAASMPFDERVLSDNYIVQNVIGSGGPITFTYKQTISFKCISNDGGAGFRMRFLRSGMTLAQQDTLKLHGNTFALVPGQAYSVDVNMSITLQPGENLLIEGIFVGGVGGSSNTVIQFLDVAEFGTFTFTNRYKATTINAVTPLYLFQQLISKISEGKHTAISALLAANASLMITSGDALRGLVGPKIKTSFSQFYKSINCQLNTAFSISNDIGVIEAKGDQFGGTVIKLGEVADLKIAPALDFLYNTIKVGYPNQDYSSNNGRDEFNNALQSTTAVTRIAKELDLVSEYRGDSYGAEFTRINLEGKTTTDSDSDNDVWFIKTDGAGKLDRSLNATATGLIAPLSVFNISISPKRMLLKHGWFIRSFLDKMDNTTIKFQTTEKNSKLVAGGITETADVPVSSLEARKFLPVLFEFETRVPEDYISLLDTNPIRKYQFTHNGITLTGIALKSGIEPSTNKTQVFQLLADASCDLDQLNGLYE